MNIVDKFRPKERFNSNNDISLYHLIILNYYTFDFDVYLPTKGINLQRGFVWTLDQKQEFIFSCLKGNDFGKVHLIEIIGEEGRNTKEPNLFQVIDGKQRLSTILSFIDNKFPIVIDDQVYYFDDLDKATKYEIRHWNITAKIGYSYHDEPITDDEKIEWFWRVNFAGTPQEKSHFELLKSHMTL